jgi:sarcosine oxidase
MNVFMTLDRRGFLKQVVAAEASLALGGAASVVGGLVPRVEQPPQSPVVAKTAGDVIVIGAGAFGGWTAYYLASMGVKVTLVDAYGPAVAERRSQATGPDTHRNLVESLTEVL